MRDEHGRIIPIYESSVEDRDTLLFECRGYVEQNGMRLEGTLHILQQWRPFSLVWELYCGDRHQVNYGMAKIVGDRFLFEGEVTVHDSSRIGGVAMSTIHIGESDRLDTVTFHIPNFPRFMDHNRRDDFDNHQGCENWTEVILNDDVWSITLHPIRSCTGPDENGTPKLTGVGEIRRIDGSLFSGDELAELVELLRMFLAFSFGRYVPLLFFVGSCEGGNNRSLMFHNYLLPRSGGLNGWIDLLHGTKLEQAFRGFSQLWNRKGWRDPLMFAINWMLEASNPDLNATTSAAIGQIPLEMLACLKCGDETGNAAQKIERLLVSCGIPLDVPAEMQILTKLRGAVPDLARLNGPVLTTRARNKIVHPTEANRDIVLEWERAICVPSSVIMYEVSQVFSWYLTLVLLSEMKYDGLYVNRLRTSLKVGDADLVPWSKVKWP